jgi:hypothetical protein
VYSVSEPAKTRVEPIIIVGMPRSGTKLLRELMNNHPLVNIPERESYFIHYAVESLGLSFRFDSDDAVRRFSTLLRNSKLYKVFEEMGVTLTDSEIESQIRNRTWQGLFEWLYNRYGPKEPGPEIRWGDKSPGTFRQLDLIHTLFPNAGFIHLIRDPRDYCLSAQKAWGKHPIRSASRWVDEIRHFNEFRAREGVFWMELRYENLITDTEASMRQICDFLKLDYVAQLARPLRVVENLGDAKGESDIISDNSGKFRNLADQSIIRQIEEIVFPMAAVAGYSPLYETIHKRPGRLQMTYFGLHDMIGSVQYHIRERGLTKGLRYYWQLHRQKQ